MPKPDENLAPDPKETPDHGVMDDPLVDDRTTHSTPIPGATGIDGVGADSPGADDAPRAEASNDDFNDFDEFSDNILGADAPGS